MEFIGRLLGGAIRAYQLSLSPVLPGQCRFHPSCSEYARQAILRFGPLRGGGLALKRLARCHPWCVGGVDEVPDAPPARAPDAGAAHGRAAS
jgi:putative membrane protein insertion efficiency factor